MNVDRDDGRNVQIVLLVVWGFIVPQGLWAQEPSLSILAQAEQGTSASAQDDPARVMYREGYAAVLEEQYAVARKKFAELLDQYPSSAYVDDASYWTAYSWRGENHKRAMELYRAFLERYPKSPYVGDAVADLTDLQLRSALANLPRSPRAPVGPTEIHVRSRIPEEMRRMEWQLQLQMERMKQMEKTAQVMISREAVIMPSLHGDSLTEISIPVYRYEFGFTDPDPELKVRLDAVRALSADRDNAESYATLRKVALSSGQPVAIRKAALTTLGAFRRFDPRSVYMDVARRDTNPMLQSASIELLARTSRDRSKTLENLIDVFVDLPSTSTRPLGTALFAIAEVGGDRATDFLIRVAHTHPNPDIRSDAVFYLGTLGTPKARTALEKILLGQ
jgi:tetratricopeptide (TPR) repeat protein